MRNSCCTGAGWGREGWLSSLILVWGGDSTLYSALDRLVDQLVEMVVQLTPLTNVGVGVMVVARFTEVGELV